MQEIIIDQRFQGPSQSANGGYVTGMMAELVDGPAEVTLKAPPRLGHTMQITDTADGFALMDGEQTVATVRPVAPMDLAIPSLPSEQAVAEATKRYPGHHNSPIPHCFVCGTNRQVGDALRVFAGPVEGTDVAASPWVPHANFADASGMIADRYVLAALDCPGAWAWYGQTGSHMLLGRMHCEALKKIAPEEACTVTAWPISRDGRKVFAGSAVHNGAGELAAFGFATWITVPEVK